MKLDNLSNTPKIKTPIPEFTPFHALGVWGLLLLLFSALYLTGCDAVTAQAITAADSTRVSDSAGAPSSQILGAWRDIDTTTTDSVRGAVFLPSGRYVLAVPTLLRLNDEPMRSIPEFKGGTWSIVGGNILLSQDSVGELRDASNPYQDGRCDSLVCWLPSPASSKVLPFIVSGSTLMLSEQTYIRIHQ